MMPMRILFLICFALLVACSDGDPSDSASQATVEPTEQAALDEETDDSASTSVPAPTSPPQRDFVPGTEVLAYFADSEFLTSPEITERVPNQFAGSSANPIDRSYDFSRSNIRAAGFVPYFLPLDAVRQRVNEWDDATATHPAVSYRYQCADGRQAHVDHFVRNDPGLSNVWQRADFLGEVSVDETTGETSFAAQFDTEGAQPNGSLLGVLQPLGDPESPYSGAEHIHTTGEDRSAEVFLQYGFYQYYSFTDQDGVEVEVLVSAASIDYNTAAIDNILRVVLAPLVGASDEEIADAVGETVTGETVNPLELINHQRVQARIDCGRELNALIAPLISELDNSAN